MVKRPYLNTKYIMNWIKQKLLQDRESRTTSGFTHLSLTFYLVLIIMKNLKYDQHKEL